MDNLQLEEGREQSEIMYLSSILFLNFQKRRKEVNIEINVTSVTLVPS